MQTPEHDKLSTRLPLYRFVNQVRDALAAGLHDPITGQRIRLMREGTPYPYADPALENHVPFSVEQAMALIFDYDLQELQIEKEAALFELARDRTNHLTDALDNPVPDRYDITEGDA